MKEKLRHRLSAIEDRFSALERDMVEHASDPQTYAQLAQEHAELLPLVQAYRAYCDLEKELAAARDLQEDPEWRDIAEEEIGKLRDKIETIESDIQSLLLPQDPNDNKNIFLEIRAVPAAMKLHFLLPIFSACTRAMPKIEAGRWK